MTLEGFLLIVLVGLAVLVLDARLRQIVRAVERSEGGKS